MFTAFTTQLVNDEISFLLIAETEAQAAPLARTLNRQGVSVTVVLAGDVKSNSPTWQATRAREYYKIIWLVADHKSHQELSSVLIDFFTTRFEPVIAVFHVTHPLVPSQAVASELVAQSGRQVALVEKLQEQLPSLNLVLAMDVVDSPLVEHSFFTYFQSEPTHQFWLDPVVTLYPQRNEDVTAYLANHLLRPHTTVPYLIKGKETSSTAFLKKVQHAYSLLSGQDKAIKSQPVQIGGEWTFTMVSNPDAAALEVSIDVVVRAALAAPSAAGLADLSPAVSQLPRPQLPPPPTVVTTPKKSTSRIWTETVTPAVSVPPTTPTPILTIKTPSTALTPPPSAVLNPKTLVIPKHIPPRIENSMFLRMATHYTQLQTSPTPTLAQSSQSPYPTLHTVNSHADAEVLKALRARMRTTPPPVSPTTSAPSATPDADAELDKELSKLFAVRRVEHKAQRVQHLTTDTRSFFQKVKRKKILFASSVLGLGISLGLLAFYLTFISSYQLLKTQFVNQLASLQAAQVVAATPSESLPETLSFVKTQMDSYQRLFSNGIFVDESALTTAVTHFLAFQQEYGQAKELGGQALLTVLGKREGDSLKLLPNVAGAVQRAYEQLSQYQASLKDFDEATLTEPQRQTLTAYNTSLVEPKKVLLASQQLNPLLPTLLGVQQKRSYALLFQNNQELRPTGGFVQAVAIVTFDKGRLIDSQVFSASQIDAKQVGAVTPPEDIQRFLGEQRWYFRDVNWDPDFPTTALNVNSFLEKTIGKPVDGVIGLNLYALEELIKATGPLELPEYNEIITDRNLQERVEFHSEIQLVPSDQKADYSVVLLTRLLQKLTNIPDSKAADSLAGWYAALESKQLQIAMLNPQENLSFSTLGWTGGLITPQCPSQLSGSPCLVDGVAQFEANIGINRANYHVTREVSQLVKIAPGTIRHQRTIVFNNNSRSNAWPQGAYKAYTRLYLPATSILDGVTINGSPLPASAITTKNQNGKIIVGFASETPIQTKTTIQVSYHQAYEETLPFSYTFFNQQQAGVIDGLSSLVIEYDPRFKPAKIAPQGEVVGSRVTFKPTQSDHLFVGIEFR